MTCSALLTSFIKVAPDVEFLSHGDFGFPFTWPLFWAKQFFSWSYQAGATNVDGIMRMPGRLLQSLAFLLGGNLWFEYFFIISSLLVVFAAFYYFCRRFLELKSTPGTLLVSLLFTVNPITLGNISKIGLILAAAMLPLCLTLLRRAFETERPRYLLLWIICLNISLIHPFNFLVNVVVSGSYFLYQIKTHRRLDLRSILTFVGMVVVALLLNAYCLLPIASMGTVNKDVLSDTIAAAPTDYTALVDVLNTGDILTGLSLSRNVVNDYEFYNAGYQGMYFLGVFVFYALLLVVYLRLEKRFAYTDRRRFMVCLGAFLLLVLLAAVLFLHVDVAIKALINLPGGWAFRSPLKWQLYIPLVLFAMLAIVLRMVKSRLQMFGLAVCFVTTAILANGFLLSDIYHKLLTPRSIMYFGALDQLDLEHRNLLLVNNYQCADFKRAYPQVMTELGQVLRSKNVQLKQVSLADLDQVDLSSYTYILGCAGAVDAAVASSYDFRLTQQFVEDTFQLYANDKPRPYISSAADVLTFPDGQAPGEFYHLATGTLQKSFIYAQSTAHSDKPHTAVQDIFGELSFDSLHEDAISVLVTATEADKHELYIRSPDTSQFYYSLQAGQLSVASEKKPGYQHVTASQPLTVELEQDKQLAATYTDSTYATLNLVPNHSLEEGLWHPQVGDCYKYDDQPRLSMSLDQTTKTDGRQSLRLEAGNHVACAGPRSIDIVPDYHYLLGIDYRTSGSVAGYDLAFDTGDAVGGRLPDSADQWRTLTKVVVLPGDVSSLNLKVHAYPDNKNQGTGIAFYDNLRLSPIPPLQRTFYLVDKSEQSLQAPRETSFSLVDPTKTLISIKGARTPFYLATTETYSNQWRLQFGTKPLAEQDHLLLNGSFNGWYIDPSSLCNEAQLCVRHDDGGYDIEMVMEFAPQRWFYIGLVITALTGGSVLAYLVCEQWQYRRKEWKATTRWWS